MPMTQASVLMNGRIFIRTIELRTCMRDMVRDGEYALVVHFSCMCFACAHVALDGQILPKSTNQDNQCGRSMRVRSVTGNITWI